VLSILPFAAGLSFTCLEKKALLVILDHPFLVQSVALCRNEQEVIVALLQREVCCPPDVVCRRKKVVKKAYGKQKWIIISGAEGKSIKTNIAPPNNWHGIRQDYE